MVRFIYPSSKAKLEGMEVIEPMSGKGMERHEPVLERETEAAAKDWGNVRFRGRRQGAAPGTPEDNADARFWIALVVFLCVALVYPWYSYWVNARLLSRDLQSAGEEFSRQIEEGNAEMRQQLMASASLREESDRQRRLGSVRVMGTIPSRSGMIAIVRLERVGLTEASATICRQAAGMLGSDLTGQLLRIQRHRGNQPALDVGSIRC